ncbi:MAG TPA: flavodoxin domain-containing protein [Vicinamibacteria bacterium]|nr:flavodoxin domain-containing protein [Vicinamibacteria bacterium]
MRVLVTWGSKHGGTEGIGRILGEALERRGYDVVAVPVNEVRELEKFDAAIVGGALYANRWAGNARRFVRRNVERLRSIPVWFFSSGPLDDSADREDIPATRQVAALADRVGAKGHITFGGRLEPDVKGFPASAMAKTMSGDWRNADRINAWAADLARQLPDAVPGTPTEPGARSLPRLLAHGIVGWALCAATMGLLLGLVSLNAALVLHAIAAPLFFVAVAWSYFRAHGARDPLPTALGWTAIVAVLDLVIVAGAIEKSFSMFTSVAGVWLPLALIFSSSWATGEIMSMMPWPDSRRQSERKAA